ARRSSVLAAVERRSCAVAAIGLRRGGRTERRTAGDQRERSESPPHASDDSSEETGSPRQSRPCRGPPLANPRAVVSEKGRHLHFAPPSVPPSPLVALLRPTAAGRPRTRGRTR